MAVDLVRNLPKGKLIPLVLLLVSQGGSEPRITPEPVRFSGPPEEPQDQVAFLTLLPEPEFPVAPEERTLVLSIEQTETLPSPAKATRQIWYPGPFPGRPGAMTRTLDRVRADLGFDLSPAVFQDHGTIDGLLGWIGGGRWQIPPWVHASVFYRSTPFGNAMDLSLFFVWDAWKVSLDLRNQTNLVGAFPGVDLEVFEIPLAQSTGPILITPRVSVWAQPQDQLDDSPVWEWGGLVSLAAEVPIHDDLWLWLEGRGKTAGWVPSMGNPGPEVSVRTGLHWTL